MDVDVEVWGEGWMCGSGMETSVSGYRIIISLQSPSASTAPVHTHTHTHITMFVDTLSLQLS